MRGKMPVRYKSPEQHEPPEQPEPPERSEPPEQSGGPRARGAAPHTGAAQPDGAMQSWRLGADGVTVAVKVQPGARRPGILGQVPDMAGLRLKIAVAEPPEDGRANRAVCATLAGALAVPASDVSVLHGAGSRQKTLHVAGDAAALAARLAAL